MQFLIAALAIAQASSDAVVSWVSEPVLPGQTALVQIVSAAAVSNTTRLEVRQGSDDWQAVATTGATAYGLAFVVPDTFTADAFDIRVDGGSPYSANRPRPWFVFGDLGDTATPGGWVRVG